MEKVLVAAFQRYCVSNPLHPDVFPAVRKMEAEVVAMCLRMYNNPTGAGATTSGGTESILSSVKTHRDWARAVKGITEPEMHVLIRVMYVYCVLTIFGPVSSLRQFMLRLTKRPHISVSNSIRFL
jgi:glutamate/tyrosine decarboxylase-like PLP-dependent enzyme